MKKIYFPNLNGLRFLAALLVIVHHVEQVKDLLGLENNWNNPFVTTAGKLGVILFFVLSGFLITYLLLEEEKITNTIAVKEFFMRRILRIWPLYYLVLVLSFFVLPHVNFLNSGELSIHLEDNFFEKLLLFIFFLPNVALVMFYPVPYASQSWSVGTEEQFYVLWPFLMRVTKKKEVLLYSVILFYLGVRAGLMLINRFFDIEFLNLFAKVWFTFSIDCMAIGGLFALYLFKQYKVLKVFYNKKLQWFVLVSLCLMIGLGIKFPYLHYEIYSVLFGILILNLASNPNTIISLENKLFNYLGKISYGLYMFHVLGIVLAVKGLGQIGINSAFIQYSFSLFITILMAGISYKYFEKYFITKKAKFSKILSGENAKSDAGISKASHTGVKIQMLEKDKGG